MRQRPYVIIIGFSLGIPNFRDIRNFISRIFARWRKQKAPQLQENTLAATLKRNLPYSEAAINFLDGRFCSDCNKVHTPEELETLGLSPKKLLQAVEKFRNWAQEANIETQLQNATRGAEDALSKLGYASVAAAQEDLKRLQKILAWQPAAAPAPAAEAGGENARQ